MDRFQFETRFRAAFLWAIGFVIVGEYTCKDVPFGSVQWLIAGVVLACLGVLLGRVFLAEALGASPDAIDPDKLRAALSRLGITAMTAIGVALLVGWFTDSDLLFNAAVAGGDFAFGLFVLWSQFWFVQLSDDRSPGGAPRRPG